MAMKRVRFKYKGGSKPGSVREVAPYGLMFGRANYLVAAEPPSEEPRNWRLDRIEDVEDVVLRILPHGAEDALVWRFHPNQKVEPQPDGSVLVTFRASSRMPLARK